MAAFFCELFSEEIPARMQVRAAEDFARLLSEALSALSPTNLKPFSGPRRLAVAADIAAEVPATSTTERGPRATAPEQALAGFLRKHNATRDAVRQEGEFWVLDKSSQPVPAATLIATALPDLLRRFPWPKSMRWGGTSAFTWVRPLRRITCLLDGAPIAFSLATNDDNGHGLTAGNETEGHRFIGPGPFAVTGAQDWQTKLREHYVIADAAERERLITASIAARAADSGVHVVPDPALVSEVAGLVEWPVALTGKIDAAFMDLPAEVMQVSMRVNQRYFATRTADNKAAPYFIFVANMPARDHGAAIISGNERVLRARFADARHFWDLDRRTKLAGRVAALDGVTFQAQLGTQGARAQRISALAARVARHTGADPSQAARAGLLAKADLTTGMVGEFPELQGIMGGYYARHDGETNDVADAIRDHYLPKGPTDSVPTAPVSQAVALADKLDQLAAFFTIGEKPTGSGDPYALRRAALGIIRIIRENTLRLPLRPILQEAAAKIGDGTKSTEIASEILDFMAERLRVQLRGEGARHDVLAAVFAAGNDDDLARLLARGEAVAALLTTEDGRNLLAAYKRAANILRIEERKDGPHDGAIDTALLTQPEEIALHDALARAAAADAHIADERFAQATSVLAGLRAPLDAFFEKVTVNAAEPNLRHNRLRVLAAARRAMNRVADFSLIEG